MFEDYTKSLYMVCFINYNLYGFNLNIFKFKHPGF